MIHSFVFNPLQENTYIVYDEGEAVIIDPGCSNKVEEKELTDFIATHQLKVNAIWNTHGHIDHVLGNYFCKTTYHAPLLIHAIETAVLRAVESYAPAYGFHHYQPTQVDEVIQEHQLLSVGKTTWRVLFLPGHSPGHVGFYNEKEKQLISGDVLFHRSVGRTDLPGGNTQTLMDTIRQKMYALPDDVTVFCGHGDTTTIGEEKQFNPYCRL